MIRDSLRRLLQLQIGALITDFVTGRAQIDKQPSLTAALLLAFN